MLAAKNDAVALESAVFAAVNDEFACIKAAVPVVLAVLVLAAKNAALAYEPADVALESAVFAAKNAALA